MTQGIGNRSCTPTTSGRTVARPEHHQVLRAARERLRRLERYKERRVRLPEDQSPKSPRKYPLGARRWDTHFITWDMNQYIIRGLRKSISGESMPSRRFCHTRSQNCMRCLTAPNI